MDPVEPATTSSRPVSPPSSLSPPLAPAPAPKAAPSPSPPPFSYKAPPATLSPPLGQFFINTFLQAFGVAAAIAFGVFAVESVRQAEVANGYAAKALEQARVANEVAMLAICMSGNKTNGAPLDDRLTSLCALVSAAGGGVVFPAAATAVFTAAVTSITGATTTTTARTSAATSGAAASTTSGDSGGTGTVPTNMPSVSASPESSRSNTSVIIGAVCGTVGGVLIVGFIILCLVKKRIRRGPTAPVANAGIRPMPRARRQAGLPTLHRPHRRRKSGVPTDDDDSLGREKQGVLSRFWRWYRATFLDSTVHTGIG